MKRTTYLTSLGSYAVVYLTSILSLVFEAASQTLPNLNPVFPSGFAGNTFSTTPFTGSSESVRFQQLYDFEGVLISGYSGPFLIHSISFREDADHQFGFSSRFPDFQINLSTINLAVDGLRAAFSENVGANDAVVIPRGSFNLGVRSGPNFGVIIDLPIPFYFDPSLGNLLLDIRNFGGGSTSWSVPPNMGSAYIDAENVVGDHVSRVLAMDVNALFGTPDSLGLVTQFRMTPIPEPSTMTLLGFAASALILRLHRTRKG